MKAAAIEKFGSLNVIDLPMPKPGAYEVLCELLYGATCTGTDLHIIGGDFSHISLPTVLGHESVGRVIEIGPKVRNLRIGDLVTRVGTPAFPELGVSVTWGGFAEFGIVRDHWAMCADGLPPETWQPFRVNQIVPFGIEPATAPMFTTWRETLSYLLHLGIKPGASVLIAGSGGNGLSFARLCVLLGASVVVTGASHLESIVRAKTGIEQYYDYRRSDLAEELNTVKPSGFDYIVDSVGRQAVTDLLLPSLKVGGTYGIYGIDESDIIVNPRKTRGDFNIHRCYYSEADTHQQISEWILQGKLEPSLWYGASSTFPLSRINEAFEALKMRRSPKALIRLNA